MSWRGLLCIPGISGRKPWGDVWIRAGWRVQRHAGTSLHRTLDPKGSLLVAGELQACLDTARRLAPFPVNQRGLVLLHGIGRNRQMMQKLEEAAAAQGWSVANLTYPSLTRPFEDHVAQARSVVEGLREAGVNEIHFAGHSMGGLIARTLMAEDNLDCRAVLIGTPNQGASLADMLGRYRLFHEVFGPCGQTLSTRETASLPLPKRAKLAVIAGGNGKTGYNPLLKGDNDGIVTVAETRLGGSEADFTLVSALHTTLPLRSDVIAATLGFLETGCLTKQAAPFLS